MFRNIIFKLVISLWFIICSPLLVIGLLSEKSEREIGKFVANGALFIARTIGVTIAASTFSKGEKQ